MRQRHFRIFGSKNFDEGSQLKKDNYKYFYHPEATDDHRSDLDDALELVDDIDTQILA